LLPDVNPNVIKIKLANVDVSFNKCEKPVSLEQRVRSQITRLKLQKSILGFSY